MSGSEFLDARHLRKDELQAGGALRNRLLDDMPQAGNPGSPYTGRCPPEPTRTVMPEAVSGKELGTTEMIHRVNARIDELHDMLGRLEVKLADVLEPAVDNSCAPALAASCPNTEHGHMLLGLECRLKDVLYRGNSIGARARP